MRSMPRFVGPVCTSVDEIEQLLAAVQNAARFILMPLKFN
jgi:hypothetical protein